MKIVINPKESELIQLLTRPSLSVESLEETISGVFQNVGAEGDKALFEYGKLFDNVELKTLKVSDEEKSVAESKVSEELKEAIKVAARNIERFHKNQVSLEREVETSTGVFCWRKSVAIQNVGLYIPGGTAPLFSTVLMLGVPAKIAGCKNVVLCTPPDKNGEVNPAILYAASVSGIKEIYKVGGAQAIAAMTIGTASIQKVDKLFGPGNQYVTAAKLFAQQSGVAIDIPAGPSEVMVVADDSICSSFVAADLLAQAEHGVDSQVVFLTNSVEYAHSVKSEVYTQLQKLSRSEIAMEALQNSISIVINESEWTSIINKYAPEHLIVMGKFEEDVVNGVVNAGSVFIGEYSAESFGDYASGTNHTLPTAGFAKAYSGVSLDSFVKKITYQKVTREGLVSLGDTVVTMAKAEKLDAHANAVTSRYKSLILRDSLEVTSQCKTEPEIKQNVDSSSSEERGTKLNVNSSFCNEVEEVSGTDIQRYIRNDLRNIKPYSSARDEFDDLENSAEITFLDANENGLFTENNRYPDPFQKALKKEISEIKGVAEKNLFLGNGSDEVLDLVFRLTTTPYLDKVAYLNPSYGMYAVLAKINALDVLEIDLDKNFEIDIETLLQQADGSRLLILCNPNNPTGKVISKESIIEIVQRFRGIVVVDEAYVDFCTALSLTDQVEKFNNLIVVQTLSKAYGMAGLRIGMAVCSENWVKALNTIKPPYNLSTIVQETAIKKLQNENWLEVRSTILSEKARVFEYLKSNPKVEKVFESEANFILFRIDKATEVYNELLRQGVVIRNRSTQFNCEDMLRISIGSRAENDSFIKAMEKL